MATEKSPILRLNTPMMVAIFSEALLPEITKEGGRWASANPKGHADLFKDLQVKVKGDDEPAGIFLGDEPYALLKNNYNYNDSNWVNMAAVTEKLMGIAKKANGGKDVTKKDISAMLLEIKETLKKAPKAVVQSAAKAAPAAAAAAATPPADQTGEQTIAEKAAAAAAANKGGAKNKAA